MLGIAPSDSKDMFRNIQPFNRERLKLSNMSEFESALGIRKLKSLGLKP